MSRLDLAVCSRPWGWELSPAEAEPGLGVAGPSEG